jgi:putative ABC transport system permease protein
MDEEVRFHLDMQAEENLRRGMSSEEARTAALRKFGGVEQAKEAYRDQRGLPFLETTWRDVVYGTRMLRKNPGFTIVAVVTLALGIGGITAIYCVIECAVLHPVPYADSHRLLVLFSRDTRHPGGIGPAWISDAEFLDFQEQNQVFDEVLGGSWKDDLLTGTEAPEYIETFLVTCNTFRVLGIPPLMGRPLTPEDARPGAPPVVVLSYKVWRNKFGGDPEIIGRTIVLNHQSNVIVGVMPPRFEWTLGPSFWRPATLTRGKPSNYFGKFMLVGRLKPSVSIQQATADVAVLVKRFAAIYPEEHPRESSFGVDSLARYLTGEEFRNTLYLLLAGVGLLLLIACMNVANLLLARATAREKEFAIRAALGASRGRLFSQFLVESLLLAFGGTILGWLLAWAVLAGLVTIIPPWEIPNEAVIRINSSVLLFTLGTTIVSVLLFGMAPALLAAGKNLQEPLKAGASGGGDSIRHRKLRNLLVVSEVALSLVLLTGAGLLIRSFFVLRHIELGYNPENVLQLVFPLGGERYKTLEQKSQFYMELQSRVRALPGVVSAALGIRASSNGFDTAIKIAGKPGAENDNAQYYYSGDGFFECMGIRLQKGRTISEEDFLHARRVAVVNRTFASHYFGSENPLGRQIEVSGLATGLFGAIQQPWFEIVGVVSDVVVSGNNGPQIPVQPAVYLPYTIGNPFLVVLLVRTAAEPTRLINLLRREVASMDKELTIDAGSGTIQDQLNTDWFTKPRFVLTMLVAFASLGLTLVCVGVYSVLCYVVSRRTKEIGVRMALGAEAANVRRMVMTSGLLWLLAGIGIGVPTSIALAKILQNRIWGITSADPLDLSLVALVLTVAGLAASYIPARRATMVDPLVALRDE